VLLVDNVTCLFGEWVRGHNAGGSISYPTLHINPQFAFSVASGRDEYCACAVHTADVARRVAPRRFASAV